MQPRQIAAGIGVRDGTAGSAAEGAFRQGAPVIVIGVGNSCVVGQDHQFDIAPGGVQGVLGDLAEFICDGDERVATGIGGISSGSGVKVGYTFSGDQILIPGVSGGNTVVGCGNNIQVVVENLGGNSRTIFLRSFENQEFAGIIIHDPRDDSPVASVLSLAQIAIAQIAGDSAGICYSHLGALICSKNFFALVAIEFIGIQTLSLVDLVF